MRFDPSKAFDESIPSTGSKVFRVTEVERGTSKTSGEGYLRCKCAILAALDSNGFMVPEPNGPNHVVSTILSFSPKAATMLAKACFAVGQRDSFDLDNTAECVRIFKGKVFVSEVIHDDYRGEKQAKIGNWKAPHHDILAVHPNLTPTSGGAPASGTGAGAAPTVGASTDLDDDVPF